MDWVGSGWFWQVSGLSARPTHAGVHKALNRDRETQKWSGLLNKTNSFTISYQNKRLGTKKTFEKERKRNLRGYHLCYIGLLLPSRHQNPYRYLIKKKN